MEVPSGAASRSRRKYSSTASTAAASLLMRSAVLGVIAPDEIAAALGRVEECLAAECMVGEFGADEGAVDTAEKVEDVDSPRECDQPAAEVEPAEDEKEARLGVLLYGL